jgi:P27 family predicted phage terminase small subunit
MGLRGPAPKPRALKELEGNPSKRPLNPREPKPAVKRPRCPAYLDNSAKREWRRLVPILERMRVLTEADEIALANLCQQYAMLQEAQIKLRKTGLLIKTRSGYIQQSPLVGIISVTVDQVIKLSREFGLTPSSRTRIQVEPAESPSQSLQRAIMRFARPPCDDGDAPARTPSVSSPPAGSEIN